jgi:hypothetical protein
MMDELARDGKSSLVVYPVGPVRFLNRQIFLFGLSHVMLPILG